MEDNKIQSFTGEMVDFTPLKYDPNTPKITQADLDKKIKEKQAMQDRLRQEAQSRKMQEFESQSNSLFESSLNTTDDKLRKQYTGASRVSDVAGVIRDYAMNNGIDLSNANDNDVIQAFMKSNPNKANGINDYLNGTTDLYTTSANIGFIKPQQEEKSENKGGFFTNLVGGAYDSVTGLGRLIAKYGSEGIGEIAKFLGADEDKVNSLVQSYQDSLKNFSGEALGADTDSWTYKGSKFAGDMIQVAAGEGLARGAIKGSQALNALSKAAGSGPLWAKAAKAGLEGAADMGLYKAVSDSELPSAGDLAEGAVLGAVFPMAGAGLKAAGKALKGPTKSIASKLELSGMLNPSKLTEVKNRLIDEGTDLASAGLKKGSAEDVGTWMIERGMKGDKPTIIEKLGNHAKTARQMKLDELSKSTTEHSIPSATKSLELIYNTISDVPGLEKTTQRVSELLGKSKYTWKEADEIKTILDDTFDIFTNAGDIRSGATKKGLANVRRELKLAIEKGAEAEGLGNIRMLNNEIQVAKSLQQGISKKDSADMAREMLSVFSKPVIGGALGSNAGPFDGSTLQGKVGNIIVGALAGKYLFSTSTKTRLASALNKLSGGTTKELERLVSGEITKISGGAEKELIEALQDVKALPLGISEAIPQEEKEALAKFVQKSLFE